MTPGEAAGWLAVILLGLAVVAIGESIFFGSKRKK